MPESFYRTLHMTSELVWSSHGMVIVSAVTALLIVVGVVVGAWRALRAAVRLVRRWRVRRYTAQVAEENRRALKLEAAASIPGRRESV